jgi:hypothetical protein
MLSIYCTSLQRGNTSNESSVIAIAWSSAFTELLHGEVLLISLDDTLQSEPVPK